MKKRLSHFAIILASLLVVSQAPTAQAGWFVAHSAARWNAPHSASADIVLFSGFTIMAASLPVGLGVGIACGPFAGLATGVGLLVLEDDRNTTTESALDNNILVGMPKIQSAEVRAQIKAAVLERLGTGFAEEASYNIKGQEVRGQQIRLDASDARKILEGDPALTDEEVTTYVNLLTNA